MKKEEAIDVIEREMQYRGEVHTTSGRSLLLGRYEAANRDTASEDDEGWTVLSIPNSIRLTATGECSTEVARLIEHDGTVKSYGSANQQVVFGKIFWCWLAD